MDDSQTQEVQKTEEKGEQYSVTYNKAEDGLPKDDYKDEKSYWE